MPSSAYLCGMTGPRDDKAFMDWWSLRRDTWRRLGPALWAGLPVGAALSVPIFLNFLAGRLWYRRADAVGSSQFQPLLLVVAVAVIAGFTGWLYSRMQWERNEERYQRIRAGLGGDADTGSDRES